MQISIDDDDVRRDIQNMKWEIPRAAKEAALVATEELAQRLRLRVIEMIPDKGGWYDLYKESIVVNEMGEGKWEVTTTTNETSPAKLPAETSLVWITAKKSADVVAYQVAKLLSRHNPWALDAIPAIYGGMPADLRVLPASPKEVNHYRAKRLEELPKLGHDIREIGGNLLKFDQEIPVISGKTVADIPFLAARLEHGLGGFPRVPIWSQLEVEGRKIIKTKDAHARANSVFADRWHKRMERGGKK